ncbi:MAG: SusF/SusE family outer membrane protein, partial [Paludibacteraceae bacterium]|nr:SusF/SusE family outer membrane protein [Paludibacteraceae bacterium]
MKRDFIIHIIAVAILFCGCEYQINLNKGEEALALEVSADTVVLNQREGSSQAIEFVWTSGTNHGTGSAITYELQIDMQDSDSAFAEGIHWDFGKTASHTLSFSHTEWQDTLMAYFPSIPLEEYSTLQARVVATIVMTQEIQVSPIVTFVVMPYVERPQELYLVGNATPNGWDAQRAQYMRQDAEDQSLFTYEGVLNRGEFKLLLKPGEWLPCYVRNAEDSTKMVYRATEEDYPDCKWWISKKSNYRIEAHVDNLTMTVIDLGGDFEEPIFYELYMIGDATPGGWSWDQVTALVQDDEDINHFSYSGPLFAGEIKFPTEIVHDWSGQFL